MLYKSLLELNFLDILRKVKLVDVSLNFFPNFAVFYYVEILPIKCKRHIIFVLIGVTAVKWNTSLSIFFYKYVHPNVINIRIFVYHDTKKW